MRRILTPRNGLILPRRMSKPARPVLDASHPLSRGLVGCWPLGQTTSATHDLVTGAVASAVNGPLAFSSAARGGVANTFNGSNQAMAGVAGQYNLRAWSVSAWLYSTTTGGGLQVAVAQADASAQNYQFWVGNTGAGFTATSSTYVSITTTALTANTWHHVVAGLAIFDNVHNPTMYYYTDGVLTLSQVVGGSGAISSGLGSFAIGRLGAYTGGVFWPGNIENVRIYNRMLFPGEVQQLFAEPFAGIYEFNSYFVGTASAVSARSRAYVIG